MMKNDTNFLSVKPNVFSIFFILFCVLGCVTHISLVAKAYFKYPTVSSTNVFMPKIIKPLDVTACFYFPSIVDYARVNRDLGTNYSKDQYYHAYPDMKNTTIAQMFKYSPETKEILRRISFKTKQSFLFEDVDPNALKESANITKYLQTSFVCYKVDMKFEDLVNYLDIALVNEEEQLLSSIGYSKALENATQFKFMLTSKSSHISSREFAATIKLWRLFAIKNGTAKASFNFIYLTHHTIQVSLLTRPFSDDCRDYTEIGFLDRSQCIDDCIAKATLRVFGKVSLFTPVTQVSDYLSFHVNDLSSNETIYHYKAIWHDCQFEYCRNPDCEKTITVTEQTTDTSQSHERNLTIWHRLSPKLSFKVVSSPAMSLIDFLLFIMSLISTWLGMSMMSLDPVKYFSLKGRNAVGSKLNTQSTRVTRVVRLQTPILP